MVISQSYLFEFWRLGDNPSRKVDIEHIGSRRPPQGYCPRWHQLELSPIDPRSGIIPKIR